MSHAVYCVYHKEIGMKVVHSDEDHERYLKTGAWFDNPECITNKGEKNAKYNVKRRNRKSDDSVVAVEDDKFEPKPESGVDESRPAVSE